MWQLVTWGRTLSIRLQVAVGVAFGVILLTVVYALLTAYTSQQSIDAAREQRLRESRPVATCLDEGLRRSGDRRKDLPALLARCQGSTTAISTVIDAQGNVVAPFMGGSQANTYGHLELVGDLVRERRAGVQVDHDAAGARMVVYMPMEHGGWGVVMEGPKDEILSVPFRVLRYLPFLGLGVLLVASLSAWLHARYVVSPLSELEKATARIASGIVDEPITIKRRDEIGRLAHSFDTMRSQIKAANDARDWWEGELERRVRERTAEVHRLMERVTSAQEEERRRLAQELHDDTAQALASLLMGVEALRESLPQDQTRTRQHVDRTVSQGSRALEDLRRVILGLRPAALDDLGLVATVRSYATARLGPLGVRVAFVVEGQEVKMRGAVESGLFRILQEAVNNIARHASARSATIRFVFQQDRIVATVKDDGKGFDQLQVQAKGRTLGLEGMGERADILGGRLDVTSAAGKGTKVRVEVPRDEAAHG